MDLSRITLVILSHNRQHCLLKTLNFYKDTKINLLVLDNSPIPLDDKLIPRNCRYLNVDEPFAIRSSIAASMIKTPYTIIGADDEIYLPSSLVRMQDFLDVNSDYVAVGGYAIAVWKYGPTIAASWAYKKTYGYHNNNSSALNRISAHTGEGESPLTSFFTCNLTRTWAAQNCLLMYAKAPLLATDAISVLTICGAGKSKYLDLVYWVRNWNQSPRSHSGWDRRIFLHEWWGDPRNLVARETFSQNLMAIYQGYGEEETFYSAWEMIIRSDKVLQKRISWIENKVRVLGEKPQFKTLKYLVKRNLAPYMLPSTVLDISAEMKVLNIVIPDEELSNATTLVSNLLPYESWR